MLLMAFLQRFKALSNDLLCGLDRAALDTPQSLKTRVLGLPNGIIKIELGGKVPFTMVHVDHRCNQGGE